MIDPVEIYKGILATRGNSTRCTVNDLERFTGPEGARFILVWLPFGEHYFVIDMGEENEEFNKKFNRAAYVFDTDGILHGIQDDKYGIKALRCKPYKAKELLDKLAALHLICTRELEEYLIANKIIFKYMSLKEGYNLQTSLGSCMHKCGNYFYLYEDKATFLGAFKNDKLIARCIVWNKGEVLDGENLEPSLFRYADRLYYTDGESREILINYLNKEGILLLWGKENMGGFSYKQWALKAPKCLLEACKSETPLSWMDTFNHFDDKRGVLYSYDWHTNGFDINDLPIHDDDNIGYAFLQTRGGYWDADRGNFVYSAYEDRYIDADYAYFSRDEDTHFSEDNDDFVYVKSQDDYLLKENCIQYGGAYYAIADCIYSSYEGEYYPEEAYEDYIEVSYGNDIVGEDNPDFVYCEREDTYLHIDDVSFSEYYNEHILNERARWSDVVNSYVYIDDNDENLK
ncbi:MAG: hypothetical protein LUC34_02535 [Campylobacter sp.]|nr:hypothetical protein [Campylobacter sp.]